MNAWSPLLSIPSSLVPSARQPCCVMMAPVQCLLERVLGRPALAPDVPFHILLPRMTDCSFLASLWTSSHPLWLRSDFFSQGSLPPLILSCVHVHGIRVCLSACILTELLKSWGPCDSHLCVLSPMPLVWNGTYAP